MRYGSHSARVLVSVRVVVMVVKVAVDVVEVPAGQHSDRAVNAAQPANCVTLLQNARRVGCNSGRFHIGTTLALQAAVALSRRRA